MTATLTEGTKTTAGLDLMPGECLRLDGMSWEDYEAMAALFDTFASRPRLTFCDHTIEIMPPPSFDHELPKKNLGFLVENYCLERDIEIVGAGELRKKIAGLRGAEPDECFFLDGPAGDDRTPNLVIEVKVTSGGFDRLRVWHPFRVPEIWIFEDGKLHPFEWTEEAYLPIAESRVLPGISIADLEELCLVTPMNKAVREFRRRMHDRENPQT
ncbi:MAG: Uma2 family endonuclease [Verrucomicrobiae bacterium]|nr:Uma2 family endonuclease [Verrucomicrobiae bacterium]MCP5542168.1 Uma2 family endonuclease [Akkermansiaceae bacterium]